MSLSTNVTLTREGNRLIVHAYLFLEKPERELAPKSGWKGCQGVTGPSPSTFLDKYGKYKGLHVNQAMSAWKSLLSLTLNAFSRRFHRLWNPFTA